MSATTAVLASAIQARRVVSFAYDGLPRVAEPHTLGVLDGKEALLAYETGGRSASGPLPEWRRFRVERIERLDVLDERFGPRPAEKGRHARWDRILAFVPSP